MQTFDMSASMDFRVVVPEPFLQQMREGCKLEDASEFQKFAQSTYPDDDDEFILCILRNGLKRHIRNTTIELLQSSGLGGSFAPVQLKDREPPIDAEPVLATEVAEVIPA